MMIEKGSCYYIPLRRQRQDSLDGFFFSAGRTAALQRTLTSVLPTCLISDPLFLVIFSLSMCTF